MSSFSGRKGDCTSLPLCRSLSRSRWKACSRWTKIACDGNHFGNNVPTWLHPRNRLLLAQQKQQQQHAQNFRCTPLGGVDAHIYTFCFHEQWKVVQRKERKGRTRKRKGRFSRSLHHILPSVNYHECDLIHSLQCCLLHHHVTDKDH